MRKNGLKPQIVRKEAAQTIYNTIGSLFPAQLPKQRNKMHKKIINFRLIAILVLISSWLPSAHAAEDTLDDVNAAATFDYKVKPGDILSISVWREADLRADVLIRPDGKFSFPLAGDVDAKGKSVEQIRQLLMKRLGRYIPDLVVSVSVTAINGNKVYVIGQVNRPGEISVNPDIDVMQALSIAGGANPFAQLNDISILRRTENGLISIPFRYGDIEKGKRLEQNIILKSGDVVVVP
jgi:polysaccharide export outer membrane protein